MAARIIAFVFLFFSSVFWLVAFFFLIFILFLFYFYFYFLSSSFYSPSDFALGHRGFFCGGRVRGLGAYERWERCIEGTQDGDDTHVTDGTCVTLAFR